MLEFSLKHSFGEFDIDMSARIEGSSHGVFGPSGHGKTTLFNMLLGLVRPDCGYIKCNNEIWFDSENDIFVPSYKRDIGVVFQDLRLFPHLSVKRNLTYNTKSSVSEMMQMCLIFNIEKLLKKKVSRCSGGEQQRIALIRTLLSKPNVLLLDEPFSALDHDVKDNIMSFIKSYCNKNKIHILTISHNPELLETFSESVFRVRDGRLVG